MFIFYLTTHNLRVTNLVHTEKFPFLLSSAGFLTHLWLASGIFRNSPLRLKHLKMLIFRFVKMGAPKILLMFAPKEIFPVCLQAGIFQGELIKVY